MLVDEQIKLRYGCYIILTKDSRMGCWNETCGFSNLPITDGMPVRAMFIKRVAEHRRSDGIVFYPFDLFQPATIMIKSTYDDYGWLNVTADEVAPLIASAEAMKLGVSFATVAPYAHDEPNFRPDDLPEDVSLWMIREDVYQMLRDIPLDHWGNMPKTVGEYADRLRVDYGQLVTEIKTELTNNTEKMGMWSFELRDRKDRLFGRTETPFWPLKDAISPNYGFDLPPENVDALIDILQIFSSMGALRKNLFPTVGKGSQDYNADGYMILANFMKQTIEKYHSDYDEASAD